MRTELILAIILWAVSFTAHSNDSGSDDNSKCLACHQIKNSGMKLTFADEETRDVFVDNKHYAKSVHSGLNCLDCHQGYSKYPHKERKYLSEREFRLEKVKTCQRCHYSHYTKVLDSVHYKELAKGNSQAATCTDCHGYHNIQKTETPESYINNRCGKCHEEVVKQYKGSVHGRALLEQGNHDVPGCIDCHTSHDIKNPHKKEFRSHSFEMCGKCHGDAKKMEPYGLSPEVVTTYLDDFHGSSNRLYAINEDSKQQQIATCYDCHGIHDIMSTKEAGSIEDTRKRVNKTCQKCHKEATPAFADAWLYHYKPTLESAPLVWIIKWVYRIMIPLTILGLVLHILLHLWMVTTNKRRRRK